jgi:hypothetical protein
MFINSNHHFPENEDQSAIYDKGYPHPMDFKIFNNTPKKFDDNKHGEDIGHQEIESQCDTAALEYSSQVKKYFCQAKH